jgi:hypothetical protein
MILTLSVYPSRTPDLLSWGENRFIAFYSEALSVRRFTLRHTSRTQRREEGEL